MWDAVSGGKGKVAVKSVRTGRWFMLHTTKADGSPLQSREAFVQRKIGQQKAPRSLAPAAQSRNPPSPWTGLLMAKLLSELGQAYPPSLLAPYPVQGYFPLHPIPPSPLHPLVDSHQVGYAPHSYGSGSGPVRNSPKQQPYHPYDPRAETQACLESQTWVSQPQITAPPIGDVQVPYPTGEHGSFLLPGGGGAPRD